MTAKPEKRVFTGAIDKGNISSLSGLEALVGQMPEEAPQPVQNVSPEPPAPVAKEQIVAAAAAPAKKKKERFYRSSLNIKYSEEMRNKLWIIRAAEGKSIGELALAAIGEYIKQFEAKHGPIVIPEFFEGEGPDR